MATTGTSRCRPITSAMSRIGTPSSATACSVDPAGGRGPAHLARHGGLRVASSRDAPRGVIEGLNGADNHVRAQSLPRTRSELKRRKSHGRPDGRQPPVDFLRELVPRTALAVKPEHPLCDLRRRSGLIHGPRPRRPRLFIRDSHHDGTS
jgi:hypothetical protein